MITNSWAANMRTPNDVVEETVTKNAQTLAEEDHADIMLFFGEWQQQQQCVKEEDDDDDDSDELRNETSEQFDPSLGARRVRRKEFAEALKALVGSVSESGVATFLAAIENTKEFGDLPEVYLNALKRFFSLLRLLLLDGLKREKNRRKASSLLKQVPSTVMNMLFKIANPISLARLGAKLSVKVELCFLLFFKLKNCVFLFFSYCLLIFSN
jgi:hypothetical protein